MTDRTPAAFATSLALHALVVAILLLFTYSVNQRVKDVPKIFELVAGEGNDYLATKAPAIGTPGAVKINVPAPAVPKPEPPKPEAAPLTPAPTPVAPPVPKSVPAKEPPSPAKKILTQLYNADRKAKREVAKEREEEQKRLTKLTKEEFDRENKAKNDKSTPPKIAKIDGPGIPKGVAGGSPENTKGGANGKALTAEEGSRMERYQSALMAALHDALEKEKPPGLSESLVATTEFHWNADGTLSGVRITKSSGSREFDDAVRAAIRRVSGSLGPRPDGKNEVVELDFRAKEQEND